MNESQKTKGLRMSRKYQSSDEVPLSVLCERLKELSSAISKGRETKERELTIRIPAEVDRDADIVLSEASLRLINQAKEIERLRACEAALKQLVMLKDYKDAKGKDDNYMEQQPRVWLRAREALTNN